MTHIDGARIEELQDLFWSETEDEWTQEWRDDLTPEESALVDEWDRAYDSGMLKLMERIVAAAERRKSL